MYSKSYILHTMSTVACQSLFTPPLNNTYLHSCCKNSFLPYHFIVTWLGNSRQPSTLACCLQPLVFQWFPSKSEKVERNVKKKRNENKLWNLKIHRWQFYNVVFIILTIEHNILYLIMYRLYWRKINYLYLYLYVIFVFQIWFGLWAVQS